MATCSAILIAKAVLPTPGTPSNRGVNGRSPGATVNQHAANCRSGSAWPIQRVGFFTGLANISATPSIVTD
ncbi:MAG: hypothetical protein WCP62_14825 [Planctomycetota bacterium]